MTTALSRAGRRQIVGTVVMFLACGICSSGCREAEPSHELAYDLVERFATAESYTNTTDIDFGSAEAARHLISGWGTPETIPSGPVTWALGPKSAFWFFTADRRAVRMTCHMWPLIYPGAPQQVVQVKVNGHAVTQIEMEPVQRNYEIDIAENVIVPGRNRVDLEYAYSGNPTQEKVGRPESVLWDWARFDVPQSGGPPRTRGGADGTKSIVLPPGSGLDYFVKLPSGSEFELVTPSRSGQLVGGASLQIRAVADQALGEQELTLPIDASPTTGDPRIPINSSGVLRISLLSPPLVGGDAGADGVEIARAAVLRPRRSQEPAPSVVEVQRPTASPNVVIYLIDALRADHLSVYGYPQATSPHIDAFAKDAATFFGAIAQTSWTRPAVASLLTGLSIPRHGIIGMKTGLAPSTTTISEILREKSYSTAAHTLNPQVSRETGFDQGFAQFTVEKSEADFEEHVAQFMGNTVKPFFLYLHTIEPHSPYAAEAPYRERFAKGVDLNLGTVQSIEDLGAEAFRTIRNRYFTAGRTEPAAAAPNGLHMAELISLYDAEVASADERFGRFLETLRSLDLYDDTLIVLLADHGEEFYDHGRLAHGMTLYRESTQIPLMIKFPAQWAAHRRIAKRVGQIDVLPTILDYLQVAIPGEVEGRSLLPLIANEDIPWLETPAMSYLDWFGGRAESVVAEGAKLIHNLEMGTLLKPQYELYDLTNDPLERNDIASERPVLAGYLHSLIRESQSGDATRHVAEDAPIVDPVFRERMHALGYLE